MAKKIVYIAADHAGFALKESLKKWLATENHTVIDLGAGTLDPKDDYPIYAQSMTKTITANPGTRGILLCGSGQGICIAANRTPGIRAALAWNDTSAALSRTDDDANILCLAGRLTSLPAAKKITYTWLNTKFSNHARHRRRVAQIDA